MALVRHLEYGLVSIACFRVSTCFLIPGNRDAFPFEPRTERVVQQGAGEGGWPGGN